GDGALIGGPPAQDGKRPPRAWPPIPPREQVAQDEVELRREQQGHGVGQNRCPAPIRQGVEHPELHERGEATRAGEAQRARRPRPQERSHALPPLPTSPCSARSCLTTPLHTPDDVMGTWPKAWPHTVSHRYCLLLMWSDL